MAPDEPRRTIALAFTAGDKPTEALYPGGPGTIATYGYHGAASPGGGFSNAGVTNDPSILQYYHFDAANPGNDFLVQKFVGGAGNDWFHDVFKQPQRNSTL